MNIHILLSSENVSLNVPILDRQVNFFFKLLQPTIGNYHRGNICTSLCAHFTSLYLGWPWSNVGLVARMFEITFSGSWPARVRPVTSKVSGWYAIPFLSYIALVVFAVIKIVAGMDKDEHGNIVNTHEDITKL